MPSETVIDLRSDFLSRPTEAMVRAMGEAARRPAVFGLREDPDQRALEARVAELLGHEDALLLPTCTMANQVGLAVLSRPGSVVATQSDAHVLTSEAGASAAVSGLQVHALPGGAMPPLEQWERAASDRGNELRPPVSALVLENTHNRSGGVALDAGYVAEVCGVARRAGVGLHLDGARLLNASVATRHAPSRLASGFDTVSLSLNKSLGAPIGAMLAGSKGRIAEALRWRQRLGGGFRPTGILAAAALVALEDWQTHIAEDHTRARRLASALASIRGGRVDPDPPTNIVLLRLDGDAPLGGPEAICRDLAHAGVLALPFGPAAVRFVTYRGVTDADADRAAGIIRDVMARRSGS